MQILIRPWIGDKVLIDDEIKAVVTAVHIYSETRVTVSVDYFHNGHNVSVVVEQWRLAHSP